MNRTFKTISTETHFTKPLDVALVAVTRAVEAVQEAHKRGENLAASFSFGNLICAVYTTPSGQLRYQVGPLGKPTRNSTNMLAVVATHLRQKAEAEEKNARRVPMVADVNYCEGHEVTVTLKGKRLLALDSGRGYSHYYHVGAIPRGQEGRQEYGGPMVPGPWAWAGQCATVLSASRAHQERDAAERADAIVVDNGSKVWVDGIEYTVQVERREYIKLVPVDTSN